MIMNFDSKNVMSFAINAIDSLTRTVMKEKYGDDCKIMFWENTYIKHQIDNRENGKHYTTEKHIKAMVYSMLSNGGKWSKFKEYFDIDTGEITAVDKFSTATILTIFLAVILTIWLIISWVLHLGINLSELR